MLKKFLDNRVIHVMDILEIMQEEKSNYIYLAKDSDGFFVMDYEVESLVKDNDAEIVSKCLNDFYEIPYYLFKDFAEEIYVEFVRKIVLFQEESNEKN